LKGQEGGVQQRCDGEVGQTSSAHPLVQGQGLQRGSLQRGGAGIPLLPLQGLGRLPQSSAHPHGQQVWVLPLAHVAGKEKGQKTCTGTGKKLRQGTLGRGPRAQGTAPQGKPTRLATAATSATLGNPATSTAAEGSRAGPSSTSSRTLCPTRGRSRG
jgi:hypothetical protein